jgi:pimeloyl-ACP methyl ester carboxylesterase
MAVRTYGEKPYRAALIHGGPGAPGYMAPVARVLSESFGVMEPLQSKDSLDGQIKELREQLNSYTNQPITLVGSSWGAILVLFVAAQDKTNINKIILVGSGVFDAVNSAKIMPLRLSRLSDEERKRYEQIQENLNNASTKAKNSLMEEWGNLLDSSDMYDPLLAENEVIEVQHNIFSGVWADYVTCRDKPGYLKSEFSKIDIPVVVIHGDYDPHPIEGIRPFLVDCLADVSFYILPQCGHYPWHEKQAREEFFEILLREINNNF